MGFNELIEKSNTKILGRFANVTVTVKLLGVEIEPFPGIFDETAEVISPFESDKVIVKPLLTAASSDIAAVTSAHVLVIRGTEYKFDGKPRPDGAGFTVVHLAVKK